MLLNQSIRGYSSEIKMRSLALALIFVGAISFSSAETYDVKRLVQEAKRLGAPFTDKSGVKLDSQNWSSERSNRTANIIIFNTASKSFHFKSNECSQGSPSSGLMPEIRLPSGRSIVYGFRNTQRNRGLQCTTDYQTADGDSWLSLLVATPFYSDSFVHYASSRDVSIAVSPAVGTESHNQVRFVISDRYGGSRLMSGRRRGRFSNHIQARNMAAMG